MCFKTSIRSQKKELINNRLIVAMKPIAGHLFVIDGFNHLLETVECDYNKLWYPTDVFMFVPAST